MGIFAGLQGTPKESRTQLFFRDDGKFIFRRLELEDTFLQEKKDGAIVAGWKHFFKTQFPFPGYGRIPADMVTLGFSRDIILDPLGMIPSDEKPKAGENRDREGRTMPKAWLVDVGNARRLKMIAARGQSQMTDKLVWILGGALLLELLIVGIIMGTRGG
jgi:hypothetical protein